MLQKMTTHSSSMTCPFESSFHPLQDLLVALQLYSTDAFYQQRITHERYPRLHIIRRSMVNRKISHLHHSSTEESSSHSRSVLSVDEWDLVIQL
jgi:hypothetical protein